MISIKSHVLATRKRREKNIQSFQIQSRPRIRKFSSDLIDAQISEKFKGQTMEALDYNIGKKNIQYLQIAESRPRIRKFSSEFIIAQQSEKVKGKNPSKHWTILLQNNIQYFQIAESRPVRRKCSAQSIRKQ